VLADVPADEPAVSLELIEFVKARIAPYKAPRELEFVTTLPRTETGKVQRFRLREKAATEEQPTLSS
jgi:2-aminobenzoate-CoA ligase